MSESPTCWGLGAANPNKLGAPACYSRQFPKTRYLILGFFVSLMMTCAAGLTYAHGRTAEASIASGACTYYVAPDGDDSNPGTETQPWATFLHAADTAQPGDTVCFREGAYPTDEVYLTHSGTASDPITFVAYSGETPILDGGDSAAGLLIADQGTSYLRVSGFILRGFRDWGVDLSGGNHHIQLDHLTIGEGEAGIHFTVGDSGEAPTTAR